MRATGAIRAVLGCVACLGIVLPLAACPGGGTSAPPDALTSGEDVLALAARYAAAGPDAAILEARASQYSDQGGIKGKVEIAVSRPGKVSFSALSPTDDLVSVLATDGTRFTAFQRGEKVCSVGGACPLNVGRFTGFALSADALVGVLVGRPPVLPHDTAALAWDRDLGGYRVDVGGGPPPLPGAPVRTQRVWVGPNDGRILRMQVREDGTVTVDVAFDDFKTVHGVVVPAQIDVKMARGHTDLRLVYREIDLTTPVTAESFAVACPTGSAIEDLPCGDDPVPGPPGASGPKEMP